jgi:hypothetical protein
VFRRAGAVDFNVCGVVVDVVEVEIPPQIRSTFTVSRWPLVAVFM